MPLSEIVLGVVVIGGLLLAYAIDHYRNRRPRI
jgi:hypothetical protein